LTYFWFSQRGHTLTNAYQLKLSTFWGALTQQRTDGALVRVITPVYESEAISEADERLQRFIFQVEPFLSEFLPKQKLN
jgi:EpsI family protein